jgi:hypothetical protein
MWSVPVNVMMLTYSTMNWFRKERFVVVVVFVVVSVVLSAVVVGEHWPEPQTYAAVADTTSNPIVRNSTPIHCILV